MAAACRHCGQPHEAFVTVCPVTGGRLVGATSPLDDDDERLVGSVIGERYHVRDVLGRGSTGTVLGAVHVHFARATAMKVLRPRDLPIEVVQTIFHSDARAAFAVAHPSLVEVFEIGTLPDGAPFFVMERLVGETLATRLARERFSLAAGVDLMNQLLSAIDAVHAHELLVRDLRPQNLFLAQRRGCRPVLKVLDFGLSRLIPLERVQARWNTLRAAGGPHESVGALAIPHYLSPERIRGERAVEPASDIFVAAAIFYEVLGGQKAFRGTSWEALLGHVTQGQPTPLSVLRPDLPEELASLVTRALSPDPRARPASACELQDELRAVFEAPRRGSSSIRPAPSTAPSRPAPPPLPPLPPLPLPPALATSPSIDHLYEEETSIDRRHIDVTVDAWVGAVVDEASADHPQRTARPPRPVEPEEEETETMPLTPEVRAHIERLMKATAEPAPTPAAAPPAAPPPPGRPRGPSR